jgi:hypothetical protein
MTILHHAKEEDVTYAAEGDTFLECAINLLQHIKLVYAPERELLKELFEKLAELTENDDVSEFDFSSPESAFSLTFYP